jgi:hypothetical protein
MFLPPGCAPRPTPGACPVCAPVRNTSSMSIWLETYSLSAPDDLHPLAMGRRCLVPSDNDPVEAVLIHLARAQDQLVSGWAKRMLERGEATGGVIEATLTKPQEPPRRRKRSVPDD